MKYELDEVLIKEEDLKKRITELARKISQDYRGKRPVLVGILRGAFVFLSDLIRQMDIDLEVDFMAVSSYGNATHSSGVVRILKDLSEDVRGRHLIIVEDIIDTGLTLNYLIRNLEARQPASIEVAGLLMKEGRQKVPIEVKYLGFKIPDCFVVGFGLDCGQRWRQLPYIASVKKGKD